MNYYLDMPYLCYSCGHSVPPLERVKGDYQGHDWQGGTPGECPKCHKALWEYSAVPCTSKAGMYKSREVRKAKPVELAFTLTADASYAGMSQEDCDVQCWNDIKDKYGADHSGIHGSAHAKGKCKPEVCHYCLKGIPVSKPNKFRAACLKPFEDAVASGRATHAEPIAAKRQTVPDTAAMDAFIDSMPALTPAVLAEVVKPAIVESPKPTRKPVPQLPAMPGMAPLGISPEKFKAPAPVVTVPVQTVPTVTEPVKPATKRDRMRAMAEDKETKTESKAIPLALPELADLRTEYKRLKAIADAANADLDVVKAKLCTEIEPHRIKACRDMGECRTSVSCDGTTFTSRHNWQSPMNKAELAIFEQACAAQGVDSLKYVDSTFTVETSGGVLADNVASLVCKHATRLQVELPPEVPDSVLDALQAAGIKLQVVHKSARVLHEDYTMKAAVENAVRACASVKAVQPVLYFSK